MFFSLHKKKQKSSRQAAKSQRYFKENFCVPFVPLAGGLGVRFYFWFGLGLSGFICGCAEEIDYHQQAKAFYAKDAGSREVDLLIHYNIKPRGNKLYIQECRLTPEDSVKTWAIYENDPENDSPAKIEFNKLRMALTRFVDSNIERLTPEYETVSDADTLGVKAQALLHLRDAIRAFYQLEMREVICAGQGVVYLVQSQFMLIHVAGADQTPESIKNTATKLDENWYYEISLDHQQEQRLRLTNVLREFWSSLQAQQADTVKSK